MVTSAFRMLNCDCLDVLIEIREMKRNSISTPYARLLMFGTTDFIAAVKKKIRGTVLEI